MQQKNDIALKRLANQQFGSTQLKQPDDVVAWLGAIQAQDYAGAKWSIGLRLRGSQDADITQAIAAGKITRTWALRGTLHLVAMDDVHWLLALLAPRIIAKNARRYRQLELDEPTLTGSNVVLARVLDGGSQMDRQTLQASLESEGISTEGQRMFYMLQRASLDGLICQGVAPKNNPIFLRLASSTVAHPLMNREEALAELAARYFNAHGPATLEDFVWWSGLLAADTRTGMEAIKSKLVQETIAGKTYFWTESVSTSPGLSQDLILLPGFDEYLVSYRDRSASIAEEYFEAWSMSKAMFSPSIVLRGQVVGLWKRKIKNQLIEITPQLFIDLMAEDNDALNKAAQAYGRFLGKPAEIHHA